MKQLFIILFVTMPLIAWAHEVRPAYLELREDAPGEFAVLWKTPMRGDLRLALQPTFSEKTEFLSQPESQRTEDAVVQKWKLKFEGALRGHTVGIEGLQGTMTDALVRIEFLDGSSWTRRLTPGETFSEIPAQPTVGGVSGTYLKLGIEHILLGYDHLLFVLALLIITRGGWKIVRTVTAFTISHSVTLTLAALGYVHLPSKPVEAIIALSIVFVAAEIVHQRRGRIGITTRAPWVVAFAFGLLHGLGFAGALSEIGLPEVHIPHALFFFSVGVELGHIFFVGTVVAFIVGLRRSVSNLPPWSVLVPTYGIGAIACYWLIDRVVSF